MPGFNGRANVRRQSGKRKVNSKKSTVVNKTVIVNKTIIKSERMSGEGTAGGGSGQPGVLLPGISALVINVGCSIIGGGGNINIGVGNFYNGGRRRQNDPPFNINEALRSPAVTEFIRSLTGAGRNTGEGPSMSGSRVVEGGGGSGQNQTGRPSQCKSFSDSGGGECSVKYEDYGEDPGPGGVSDKREEQEPLAVRRERDEDFWEDLEEENIHKS